jgi:hypothetical protein
VGSDTDACAAGSVSGSNCQGLLAAHICNTSLPEKAAFSAPQHPHLRTDYFVERALAQEQFVGVREQAVAHVGLQVGNEAQTLADEKLLARRLRDVAFVAEECAEQAAHQRGKPESVVSARPCPTALVYIQECD